MSSVLIIGAAGFVGSHTARLFLREGWEVTAADLRPDAAASALPPGLAGAVHPVDIRQRDSVLALAAEGPWDGIVHCAGVVGPAAAALDVDNTIAVNVTGTLHVAELAVAVGANLTYLSTATLYGDRTDVERLTEELAPRPVGIYDATKLMGEVGLAAMRARSGLRCSVLRPSFVYGPGSAVGEYFLPTVLAGQAVRKPAGADHPCEFTYVKDLARAVLAAQSAAGDGEVCNISSGQYRTLGDLAAVVRERIPGSTIEIGPGVDPARHWRLPMSLERARDRLGYEPAYSLEAGVDDWLDTVRACR